MEYAISMTTTVGSRDKPIGILKDAILRGNRLLPAVDSIGVLNMCTEMLSSAKGVSKELYAADMAVMQVLCLARGSGDRSSPPLGTTRPPSRRQQR